MLNEMQKLLVENIDRDAAEIELREQLESARRWAVRLEQVNAEALRMAEDLARKYCFCDLYEQPYRCRHHILADILRDEQ